MPGVKGWFSHPHHPTTTPSTTKDGLHTTSDNATSSGTSAPSYPFPAVHDGTVGELGQIVPPPRPAATSATGTSRRWSWRHSHNHSNSHTQVQAQTSPAATTTTTTQPDGLPSTRLQSSASTFPSTSSQPTPPSPLLPATPSPAWRKIKRGPHLTLSSLSLASQPTEGTAAHIPPSHPGHCSPPLSTAHPSLSPKHFTLPSPTSVAHHPNSRSTYANLHAPQPSPVPSASTWHTISRSNSMTALPVPIPSTSLLSPSSPSSLSPRTRQRVPSRARAPSVSFVAPVHPNGKTRFKPGTRPTWRFLKNLRSPVYLPVQSPLRPKTKRQSWSTITKNKKIDEGKTKGKETKEGKCKGKADRCENPSNAQPSIATSTAERLAIPVLRRATTSDREPVDDEKQTKPSRSFSFHLSRRTGSRTASISGIGLTRRRAVSPRGASSPRGSMSPRRAVSPPPSPGPQSPTSSAPVPNGHGHGHGQDLGHGHSYILGIGRPWRPSSPPPLRLRTPSRPSSPLRSGSPALVHGLPSAPTMTTFVSTATSSPTTNASTLPSLPAPLPLAATKQHHMSGSSKRFSAPPSTRTTHYPPPIPPPPGETKGPRSHTAAIHVALSVAVGFMIALSPAPQVVVLAIVIAAVMAVTLCPLGSRAARDTWARVFPPAWRLWHACGDSVGAAVAVWRWTAGEGEGSFGKIGTAERGGKCGRLEEKETNEEREEGTVEIKLKSKVKGNAEPRARAR